MFRVLSDEESRKVTRWKAPELGSSASTVVADRALQNDQADAAVAAQTLLGSVELDPSRQNKPASALQLKKLSPGNVLANGAKGLAFHPLKADRGNKSMEVATASAQLLQSSYDEGYARGYAEGSAALHQASVIEMQQLVSALTVASQLHDDTQLEQELTGMCFDIARMLVHRELRIDPQTMHGLVLAGLDQLPGGANGECSVYLHPLDAERVRDSIDDTPGVHIIDDAGLSRGACRIESGCSSVHAGVDDWLAIAARQLGLHDHELAIEPALSSEPERSDTDTDVTT